MSATAARPRLHVVTGKGGTGKTSIAAGLAVMLARRGGRVLVCEIEGRQGLPRVFGTSPWGYSDRLIHQDSSGGQVYGLAVDAESALLDYLDKVAHAAPVGAVLRKFGAIEFVTTIAPGLRDVLLTGKVYEAVGRQQGGRSVYDAVVLDAPPTGRSTKVLGVNAEVAGLAKVGPIHSQAESIMRVFRSPTTAVHLTTLLEETPVQEVLAAHQEFTELGLPVGRVIANRVGTPVDERGLHRLRRTTLVKELVAGGVIRAGNEHTARSAAIADALLREGAAAVARSELEHDERERLSALTDDLLEISEFDAPITATNLDALADALEAQW